MTWIVTDNIWATNFNFHTNSGCRRPSWILTKAKWRNFAHPLKIVTLGLFKFKINNQQESLATLPQHFRLYHQFHSPFNFQIHLQLSSYHCLKRQNCLYNPFPPLGLLPCFIWKTFLRHWRKKIRLKSVTILEYPIKGNNYKFVLITVSLLLHKSCKSIKCEEFLKNHCFILIDWALFCGMNFKNLRT